MQLPGFYTEVLQDLRLVCKGETRFLLQVDETDLKEQVVVCHRLHKVFGLTCIYDLLYFIQHYTQLLQEKNKANKVLVFLLIPLNFTFKIPVAFFFTRTASGDELFSRIVDLKEQPAQQGCTLWGVCVQTGQQATAQP